MVSYKTALQIVKPTVADARKIGVQRIPVRCWRGEESGRGYPFGSGTPNMEGQATNQRHIGNYGLWLYIHAWDNGTMKVRVA